MPTNESSTVRVSERSVLDPDSVFNSYIVVTGTADYGTNTSATANTHTSIGFSVKKEAGISPQLYFKYIKKKFNLIEQIKIDGRLKKLEKAFDQAVENGQDALAEKFLREVALNTKETELYAKGYRVWIKQEDLSKHKRNIKGGHISDTRLKDYTRVIPANVVKKIKQVESIFDDMIVYHYWNEEEAKKVEKKEKMSHEEKGRMRDPVLFGRIKEAPERLYFIADWEDEYCDLTFDDIIEVVSAKEITNKVKLGEQDA